MKDEIQCIISGKSIIKYESSIQTVLNYLRRSQESGSMAKTDKHFKKEETKRLKLFVEKENLWVSDLDLNNYISEGAEQKVYLKDGRSVLKLNDAIYYISWIDYLHNLLLHNYFFPDTAYQLLGFFENNSDLYAVVEQPYVKATEKTDLNAVKQFMSENGFNNIRNNDYVNPDLGIILEDLHDENVVTQNGVLFFIDTVFYIV
jgi:hypothetical protein